ncbi:hypothetical protein F511_29397 [Dorcoceras hygrometricum]|uniref:Uncharacterized protein n=1 Tax=Dorcoceras hygrometricum TaxID=472368 RepID=A0A2Z7CFR6_9LAMI|nr:hypothetical protein F511_29397 [Dorcoceras hygrometricum]
MISSGLLVQADEGVSLPIVDLIDVIYRRLPLKSNKKGFIVDLGHRHPPCAATPSQRACARATCALVAHGGRVLAVSLLHGGRLIGDGMRDMMGETRPAVASMVARLDAHWPRGWPLLRAACWASLCDDGGRTMRH